MAEVTYLPPRPSTSRRAAQLLTYPRAHRCNGRNGRSRTGGDAVRVVAFDTERVLEDLVKLGFRHGGAERRHRA